MSPKECNTLAELSRAAIKADRGIRAIEVNFPATIIMATDAAKPGPGDAVTPESVLALIAMAQRQAEQSLLQLAFLNDGVNPPSTFITQAYEAGWRYRDGTFFKI